jgi:hypothetical protein
VTTSRFRELAFTPTVKALQAEHGSRAAYARGDGAGESQRLGPDEAAFLAERDSFYLASVGETGWPYVQHRGGPPGFVRVLDERRLAFADYRGNRQYISTGNVRTDDRVALIFVDYPAQTRLKVLARAATVEAADDPELMARLAVPGYDARIERAFVLAVEGFDWNCPQHIVPRYTREQIAAAVEPLRSRLTELERDNAALRAQLAAR